jgi:hypothetical protein
VVAAIPPRPRSLSFVSTSPEASPALFPATPERADLHRQSPIPMPVPMEYLWSLHALVAAMARGEVPSSFPPLYAEGVAVASVDLTSIKARALHASSSRARSNASSRHTTMPGFRSTISVFPSGWLACWRPNRGRGRAFPMRVHRITASVSLRLEERFR